MTDPGFIDHAQPLDADARATLFTGALLVRRQSPPMARLVEHLGHMAANAFHPHDPLVAHDSYDTDAYLTRLKALRAAVRQDTGVASLFQKLLVDLGADLEDTFSDRLNLRLVPPNAEYQGRPADPLAPHRDTWGSNVMAQLNLWAPLAPVDADATMAIFPGRWARPTDNDSAGWDLEALRRDRAGYPRLPVATGGIDDDPLPVPIDPGDILVFSGAHLHASRMARTDGPARVSFDFRVVMLSDVREGRGAPDIDGAAPNKAPEWFTRPTDGLGLDTALKPLMLAP